MAAAGDSAAARRRGRAVRRTLRRSRRVVPPGMAGLFTGVVQTPITAFVFIMEMTDSHRMLPPLTATALLAHGSAGLVAREPLCRGLARRFLHRDTVRSDR